jgi:predicted TIM-barrel fold metal-dependent hydrolase
MIADKTSGAPRRRLITSDSHWAPPLQLADELPAAYRGEVPHIEERSDGRYFVRPRQGITDEFNWREKRIEAGEEDRLSTGASPGSFPSPYPKGRLAEMEKEGVLGEVLIGPGGFGLDAPEAVELAWCGLLNDWLAENYRDYLHQFAPGIHLPFAAGMKAAVKELERAAKLGLRPVLLPDYFPGKPYYLPEWEPLWEAAASLKVPVTVHISPNRGHEVRKQRGYEQWRGVAETGLLTMSVGQVETVCWFVFSGILERYPDLKIVMTEGSAGWLSWVVEYADYAHLGRFSLIAQMMGGKSYAPLKEKPSDYIRRQLSCTFMYDPVAVKAREVTGLDCLLWGNDYPHFEGIFPSSQDLVAKQFAGVPEAEIDQMVRGNASRLFGLTG